MRSEGTSAWGDARMLRVALGRGSVAAAVGQVGASCATWGGCPPAHSGLHLPQLLRALHIPGSAAQRAHQRHTITDCVRERAAPWRLRVAPRACATGNKQPWPYSQEDGAGGVHDCRTPLAALSCLAALSQSCRTSCSEVRDRCVALVTSLHPVRHSRVASETV